MPLTSPLPTPMPNAPKTKIRGVRIPDDLWADAQAMAADEGGDVSSYVRDDLARRVRRWRKQQR
jgi:hypothetical protein